MHERACLNVTSATLLLAAAAAVSQLFPLAAQAAVWTGANVATTNTSTDIDLASNWDTAVVPGSSEPAILTWSTAVPNVANTLGIVVAPTAVFSPASLELNAGIGSGYLQIDKDLTLSSLTLAASGTTGSYYQNRLRLGVNAPVTFTLTGPDPVATETWNLIQVSAVNKTVFNLTNSTVNLPTIPSNDARANLVNGPFSGGVNAQTQAQQTANPEFNISAAGGTVNIAAAGSRNDGNLNLGYVSLGVRSDQTWNADPTSFVRLNYRHGAAGVTGPQVVRRLDAGGTRLDNLDSVNLVIVGGTTGTSTTTAEAMRLAGGEYGSLRFAFGSTSYRNNHLILDGSVHLKGNIVTPGDNLSGGVAASVDPAYGLALQTATSGSTSRSHKYLVLNGHALTVNNGVLIDDHGSITTGSTTYVATIAAADSTVNVGGDIVIRSYNANPTAKALNASNQLARGLGIVGNGSTVINVGGNYTTNTASNTGGTLASSTLNLVGGDGGYKTFEVADAASRVTHVTTSGTFNIGTFNVGTASSTGMVRLVNDFLNDNPIALAEDPNVAKTGEKLITAKLAIAAGSTLDVNALNVLIGSGSLEIAPTGTLDLHSGLTLVAGGTINTFLGIGNQVATWNLYASRVVDSSNPTMGFSAIESGGFTMWQAAVIPEPGAFALLGVAAAGLIRRRRSA